MKNSKSVLLCAAIFIAAVMCFLLFVDNTVTNPQNKVILNSSIRSNPGLLLTSYEAPEDQDDSGEATEVSYAIKQDKQVVRLAEYIAENRVPILTAYSIARAAVQVGKENRVDPILIAAIVEKESTYKLRAVSPSGKHHGLMQVNTRIHRKKISAAGGFKTPQQQIEVGVAVLKEYTEETGSLKAAMKKYSGGSASYYYDVERRRKKISKAIMSKKMDT
jgi:soluble lytic murein transglycosylase-like protein